ncbi:hypothetical protein [Corynebacterium fournieri]|uniref:hypothetical protein n=1 Tax=Corynebacterium fournieri TaxID=1852390 RepID=UPI000A2F8A94|nr:hypothetical protein [Corynebacterium fournieri]WJY98306.1 hypothetical protein CFOUR_09610 [Corynebacterium fournieri]
MKRTIRTLTAAAMAGAIAFSVTPAADAQTATTTETAAPEAASSEAAVEANGGLDLPTQVADANGNYYQLINGAYVPTELPAGAENVPELSTNDAGDLVITFKDGSTPAITIPARVDDGSIVVNEGAQAGAQGNPSTTLTLAEQPNGEPNGTAAGEPKPVEGKAGATGTAGATGEGKGDVEVEVTGAGSSNGAAGDANSGLSTGAIAAIAAAAIGVPIVIAGVTYFLNQDGQTLVGSSDRVNQEPTPEEKAKSDQLRAEHADEIAAQQAAAATRGVEAETGSNTVARTLFALVLATLLGVAAFVAGRRFLV